MWTRGVVGVLLCVAGAVWIAQGSGAMHGSSMTGHRGYAVLGAVAAAVGVALLAWAELLRRRRTKRAA